MSAQMSADWRSGADADKSHIMALSVRTLDQPNHLRARERAGERTGWRNPGATAAWGSRRAAVAVLCWPSKLNKGTDQWRFCPRILRLGSGYVTPSGQVRRVLKVETTITYKSRGKKALPKGRR